jgi:FtsZ-binding cell division protein ZapB
MKDTSKALQVEYQILESLRKDLTYRIDEIECLQTELECLKNIRQKLDAKIGELNAKLKMI